MHTPRSFAGWLLVAATILSPTTTNAGLAPDFPHDSPAEWINSAPLSLARLRGKIVLIEFWTFDCSNCLRSLPWLTSLESRIANHDLVVIGVHTPELADERPAENVRAAVRRLGLRYPIMLDTDYSYWNALGNQYWPAFYLVGRDGSLISQEIGEMHAGEPAAQRMESRIRALLAVPTEH